MRRERLLGRFPRRAAASVLVPALLATLSCAVGPDYRRPEAVAQMPERLEGAGVTWRRTEPASAAAPKGPWWEVFGDPELSRLESEAASANQDIRAAAARYAEARASADVARSGLFPRLAAGASATRQQDSRNRPLSTTGEAAGKGFTFDNYTIPFDASYEVDLWGRVRRQLQGARANEEASAADWQGVRLSVEAEVAADYFTLRSLLAEERALAASVEAYQKSLELTRNRREAGLSSDLDVAQAETLLNAARAQQPALEEARLRFVHALAVLVGQSAPLFHPNEEALAGDPPLIQPGLPSTLLERRPDVAAAERRMAAANAAIGVAEAAFFPVLKLGGAAGFQSIESGTLLSAPSRFWAVGPSLALPLFEGGQRRAGVRSARARYDETVALYRQTVLRAFAEVEDNLAAQRLLEQQYEQEKAAYLSASRQLELAQNRYRGGLVSYLAVATAQSAAQEHARTVARLLGQRYLAAVALIKSLGGRWGEAEGLGKEDSPPGGQQR
ncbi:MAG: efflux transporter outer membrane subunit [Halothiobacillaceae bacterium]